MVSLQSDIVGRVKRLGLKPTEKTSLLPLQEALSNALHAIDDKFKDKASELGNIVIEVLYKEGSGYRSLDGFSVSDNGVGLGPNQFDAFCKPDTVHKLSRGGKGVGRLVWLKTFNAVSLDSTYLDNGHTNSRVFDFVLEDHDQIRGMLVTERITRPTGTVVYLRGFDPVYASRCPAKSDGIAKHVVSHFMPVLAAGTAPQITLVVDGIKQDINAFFSENVVSQSESSFTVEYEGELIEICVRHIKCNKSVRGTKNFNNMLLCAHGRSVLEASVDQALGLKSLDGDNVYIACVSSPMLDATVNQERTDFFLSEEEKSAVRRGAIDQAKVFLSEYIDAVITQKKMTAAVVIDNNPQYMYLKADLSNFVRNLPPGASSKEDILIEMARHRYRKSGLIHRMQEEITEKKVWNDEVSQAVEALTKLVDDDQKGVLAEYVLKRRAILGILDSVRHFEDPEKRRYPLEDAIHQLVCPMRTDSTKLSIEDHNLWLIDDRLALSEFFWSDKPFKSVSDVSSADRPDILFPVQSECAPGMEQAALTS